VAIARPRWRLSMFEALLNRHFRWLWFGSLAGAAGFEMSNVVQGWQVYDLTGSAFALGWVSAAWSVTSVTLSLFAGVLSDRVVKRQLVLWMRGGMAAVSLALAVLAIAGVMQVWHLAAASLARGALFALMMPAEQSYLAELVERKALLNALSLNSIGMGLAGIFAASIAGSLIDWIGPASVYIIMTVLYIVTVLVVIPLPRTRRAAPSGNSVWSDLRQGMGYLRASPGLVLLIGLGLARGLFTMSYRTFMPKYAEDVMGLDAAGLGILLAAPGVGSLISSLALAALGDLRGKGRLLIGAGVTLGLFLVLFANVHAFVPVLVLLAVIGVAGNIAMVTNQALLQMNCEPAFLGRAMSTYMMMFGLSSLGTLPAGTIADRVGVPIVVTVQGALFVLIMALVALLSPHLRRL
jgi:MFS family permease